MSIREYLEAKERETLAPYATFSIFSKGRTSPEEPDPLRTCFQRDRDRIIHSKAFRRLKHKTQVFIAPEGDHYRTRLTHTLEVSQIARTIARALRLNEDLTEAIALGHDVGHTPFGHAGEEALDTALRRRDSSMRFRHYEQSLRVVQYLERGGQGLNLCQETLEGIGSHSKGDKDLSPEDLEASPSLESAVVRIADRIAYLNHDVDDALRAGWLKEKDLPQSLQKLGSTTSRRIGAMVNDVVETSLGKPLVQFSPTMFGITNELKDFMFEKLYYDYANRLPEVAKAKRLVEILFDHYADHPELLPKGYEGLQGAVDFVSGMTDRYAIRIYEELFVPSGWALERFPTT
ncbi:MAG: deoxyguanosinetriphosphate triphosphohydrolase [Candidatus Caldarchaeum sp.]